MLGDVSFEQTFGHAPDNATNEHLRITTHLQYVEARLRAKAVSALSPTQRASRSKLLDLLHTYWTAGVFPNNYDHPTERKPCFIDRDGNICAVGYLVAETAGRDVAESINSMFQYANIFDMDLPALSKWVAASGLSMEECAMIQPTYGNPVGTDYNYIEPEYGVGSALLSGANVSLAAINTVQLAKPGQSKAAPILGLVAGAAQISLGLAKMPEEQFGWGGTVITNESQKTLSLVNIGVGSTALFLSAYNLVSNRKPRKDKKTSWNLYSYPTRNNEVGVHLGFTRRI